MFGKASACTSLSSHVKRFYLPSLQVRNEKLVKKHSLYSFLSSSILLCTKYHSSAFEMINPCFCFSIYDKIVPN